MRYPFFRRSSPLARIISNRTLADRSAARQLPATVNQTPVDMHRDVRLPWLLWLFLILFAQGPSIRAAVVNETPEPADLSGSVLDEEGKAVVGAEVFIESARPRHGASSTCSTCYPDCGKHATTNEKGEFTIPSVDPDLLYHLLMAGKGYEGTSVDKADPQLSPLSLALFKRAPLGKDERLVLARVYTPQGKPIGGAFLDIQGAESGQMTTWGGHKQYIHGTGISDAQGMLALVAGPGLTTAFGTLRAPGYAEQWVKLIPGKDSMFFLHEGAIITGQVVKDDKPVPALRIGFAGSDRMAGEFLRGWDVPTDADGRFTFPHLTPGKSFIIYSIAKSSAKVGVLPTRTVSVGKDGAKLDLGKIELQPALRIRGRVVTADGEPALPGSRIGLGRDQAWDYQEANLNEEANFEFNGLTSEIVEISLRMSGYKISKKNPNRLSDRSIAGRLLKSMDDFLVIVEPAEGGDQNMRYEQDSWQVRETPLRSAEK